MEKERMHLGATWRIFERAESLRASETTAEKILWNRVSKNQLGFKFRRQHPIMNYIVDFYCHAFKLAIELDGSIHEAPQAQFYDDVRANDLESHGIKVIRFTNEEVISNTDHVIEEIRRHLFRA